MKWREPNDFPEEGGEYLVEVIKKGNGETSIHPTYARFILKDQCWFPQSDGYTVHRWLDESDSTTEQHGWTDETVIAFAREAYGHFYNDMERGWDDGTLPGLLEKYKQQNPRSQG